MRLFIKGLMVAGLLAVASLCYGFVSGPSYEVVTYQTVHVGPGLTLWQIADANYSVAAAPGMCFEEFYYNLRHIPANEYLTANGRMLQVSDVVLVPVYRVAK